MTSQRIGRGWIPFCFLLLMVSGCARKNVQSAGRPGVPVRVTTVVKKNVPIHVSAIGNGEAYSTVSIKAQVSAELTQVHFTQGQFVHKGDLLFTLDQRSFNAALHQAEANLARDKAQAENAVVQEQRYRKLYEEGVAPKEQADQYRTGADAMRAAVQADEAAVENAKLQLEYCSISSPIDGRTGSLMLYPGNLTKANDVPVLVVIDQITPIYVTFAPPENILLEVKRRLAAGEKLKVEAYVPDDPQHAEQGLLSFVDNSVDATTGTIKMKGTFANPGHRLWPGEFVNVVLTLGELRDAVVVPSQAVQSGQEGQYVFVVKPDETVESHPVEVAKTLDGWTVVSKGLQPGEVVVTDGQLGLVSGAKVQVKTGSSGS